MAEFKMREEEKKQLRIKLKGYFIGLLHPQYDVNNGEQNAESEYLKQEEYQDGRFISYIEVYTAKKVEEAYSQGALDYAVWAIDKSEKHKDATQWLKEHSLYHGRSLRRTQPNDN